MTAEWFQNSHRCYSLGDEHFTINLYQDRRDTPWHMLCEAFGIDWHSLKTANLATAQRRAVSAVQAKAKKMYDAAMRIK